MYIFRGYICSSSFQLFTYTTFIVILLFSVLITMFNKCTISEELCSSYSLLSFTCFCIPPFNPFLLYTTLSRGLSRHHHVVKHVIHTTPISHIPSTIHTLCTYRSHVDNINNSLLHYTYRATLFQKS